MQSDGNINPDDHVIDLNQPDPQAQQPPTLLGFLIADKFLNTAAVIRILTRAWSDFGEVHIEAIRDNRTFTITPIEAETGQLILDRGPWSVMGHTISINTWPLEARLEDVPVHSLAIWIQTHGLPRGQMTRSNANLLGAVAGSVMAIEDPDSINGSRGFLRVRVNINTLLPLTPGVWIRSGANNPTWVEFRYERISLFCYNCGRLGHSERFCNQARFHRADRLGVWMITPAARHLSHGSSFDSERGWDRFERQSFQTRQNCCEFPSSPLTQALVHVPPLPSTRPLIIFDIPSPPATDTHQNNSPISVTVASSSVGHSVKGKAKVDPVNEPIVEVETSLDTFLPHNNASRTFPTLGSSGEISLGNTQFIFNHSLNEFVPLDPPSYPFLAHHTHSQTLTQFAPLYTSPQPHNHTHSGTLADLFPTITHSISQLPLPPTDHTISGIAAFLDQLRLKRLTEDVPESSTRVNKKSKIAAPTVAQPDLSLAPPSIFEQIILPASSPILSIGRQCIPKLPTSRGRGRGRGARGARGRARSARGGGPTSTATNHSPLSDTVATLDGTLE
ncbi:putative transcription factor interactor and regulator CCHC(Zn) family [Rosa chinensis]|uniref:Putative transcription factor interactor and regulator CCHC(Zn) family n=1 Tax=Rosa chinensis TaxID=74649 RepID=A0A2P6QTA2_ROSCH|nr:uncharacterized protein LOC121052461 isoform X2 [Rosa chinensis]PRQ37386.1 putative transcription factor interactor and regulator CCHC(Zn) family [Rosa chinensis]